MSETPGDRRAVIVMAKRPAPGATKTRLTPALPPEQAAQLYERLLLDTIESVERRSDCTTVIAIDTSDSAEYFATIAPGVRQVEQVGAALGDRLDTVMTSCLADGFTAVFALGSDSPDLPVAHLDAAFAALDREDTDAVLGPSDDGGYYLIGWKQRWAKMVTGVQMSTPHVLHDTMRIAGDLGARMRLAPSWYDIDSPADLERLRSAIDANRCPHTADFLTTHLIDRAADGSEVES